MNNIVGKMLIVLQLVFCILFMCFAGAVYSFQGAWRNKANDLENRLSVANKATEDANASRDRETKQLKALLDQAVSDRDNVKANLSKAVSQAETSQELLAQTSQERDKAFADGLIATKEAAARVAESGALNKEVSSLRSRITDLIQRNRDTEDTLLDRTGKLASYVEKEEQYLSELGRLRDLLRLNDIEPNTPVTELVAGEIEKVDGFVVKSIQNQARTQEFLQITIGSDDKVRMGQIITIYRADDYICRARVMKVFPDEAICIVDEKTRTGSIQRGDNVTTKL